MNGNQGGARLIVSKAGKQKPMEERLFAGSELSRPHSGRMAVRTRCACASEELRRPARDQLKYLSAPA